MAEINTQDSGQLKKIFFLLCCSMQETWVGYLGGEDPLEKEMITHSSILA